MKHVFEKNRAAAGTLTSRVATMWDVPSETLPTGVPPNDYLTAIYVSSSGIIKPFIWMKKWNLHLDEDDGDQPDETQKSHHTEALVPIAQNEGSLP